MEGKNKGKNKGEGKEEDKEEDKEERKVKEVLSKSSIRKAGKGQGGGRFKRGILGNKGLVGMGEVREKLKCRG